MLFITGRNEVVAKVIFLHLFVILFTGGVCIPAYIAAGLQGEGCAIPAYIAGGIPACLAAGLGGGVWHTVNERPVRILLECILVLNLIANIFKIAAGH